MSGGAVLIELSNLQQLVLDVAKIERNHNIPGDTRHENVVEHSFAVALLCWKLHSTIKHDLDIEKIFKYCVAHDFLERGLKKDVNTYADENTRQTKKDREALELIKLADEFSDFPDLISVIKNYERAADEESRFVWTVDKMQAIILGEIDNWRPYERVGITHKQFCEKGDEFMKKCPTCLKPTLELLNRHSREVFYDQPKP